MGKQASRYPVRAHIHSQQSSRRQRGKTAIEWFYTISLRAFPQIRDNPLDFTPLWCIVIDMSEKWKPTYDLDAFKSAFNSVGRLAITGTALRSAAALGFGRLEIVLTIQSMRQAHFYKSMTAYANHRLWQDVYHVPSAAGLI
ncbi:MAG: type II toxin-antitoxin system MqsR family toxin, partial [Desulfatirhabdiaceae bacterium]